MSLRGLPSVRQLRAFVAVYQSGHVSAAAQMLSVTQPAVTVLLREMEERLGVRLFDRSTRSLRRTEAAVEAYGYAVRTLAELESLGRSMADYSGSRRGRLRIAATSTVAQTLLPSILRGYAALHPDVQLLIDDCSPGEFVERIVSGRVDCGIGTLEAAVPSLVEQVFLRDSLVAVATPRYFSTEKHLTWKQLSAYPVITVKPGYGVRRRIDRAALDAGVELRIANEVSLLTTAIALAAGGLGVAVVPGSIVGTSRNDSLKTRRILRPLVERNTAFIFRRGSTLPPTAVSLQEFVFRKP
ncbi:DNA-binding transcriptional LysR family regulator [Variovorax paradoxus]|uniref:LysR family transcriptional regulator n=1 Tax=Variovorax TaxID=34072 RepID=UPI00119C1320|nr:MULTISPECIES: LysR family transcriptional regulator [Variovorax]MDR6522137.1 DNA-binding transcriptional LysR family regulator [Variovorax paradoxus]